MPETTQPVVNLATIIATLLVYPWRWFVPTFALTMGALAYAHFHVEKWEASQALLVRDEAAGNVPRPGRFVDADSRKTAQETVWELAKSRALVAAALAEVGPANATAAPAAWPTEDSIEKTQEVLQVTAPNGAEFGRTEVFYLKLKDRDPERAMALSRALCQQLIARLQQLRDCRAQSLVDELSKTVALAQADLEEATARVAALERQVGDDLGELRLLTEATAGDSNLRQTSTLVKNELRQARTEQQTHQQLLEMLLAAQHSPETLLAAPSRILDSQPALRQLRDALVAAQLRSAELLGQMSEQHPKVQAARAAEELIRQRLHGERAAAINGLKAELQLSTTRAEQLERQLTEVIGRMNRLAGLRAQYGNLIAEVRQRSEMLNKARHELSEAQATQASAHSASLITLLDSPVVGTRPVGPSKELIALAGLLGGLLTGWGMVFLTVPTPSPALATAVNAPVPPPATGRRTASAPPAGHGLSLKKALTRLAQGIFVWN